MGFTEIFCQDRAIASLCRAFGMGRTAHAYIFAGPEGVGKFKTAAAWADLLLCLDPVTQGDRFEACGLCASCRAWEGQAHPDFFPVYKELREFTKDGKGKAAPVDMPVDVIREFLIAKVSTRPTLSHRKVFVVSEAEKLNTASQNALLKILEEPPSTCCIVLLCTRLERLLPTTKSRTQIIRFGPVDQTRIAAHLQGLGLDATKAQYFACLSQGSLGTACHWAELEQAGANLYGFKVKLVTQLVPLKLAECLGLAEALLAGAKSILETWTGLDAATSKTDLNRRALKTVVSMVVALLTDVMKQPLGLSEPLINADQADWVGKAAARLGPQEAADKIAECFEAVRWIEAGVNERLIFERLLLRIAGSGIMPGL
ncbi:MAG: hypothetical protein K9N55_04460 [Phycisphaerae bacterium]|nr:hypothetical protein [Phycisphaerae bacterium]